jgi:hypothetical protein
MRFFGKRMRWGMKLWFGSMLLLIPIMFVGELIEAPWLFFAFDALMIIVVMPVLNTLDGRNKKRGGPGILWERETSP